MKNIIFAMISGLILMNCAFSETVYKDKLNAWKAQCTSSGGTPSCSVQTQGPGGCGSNSEQAKCSWSAGSTECDCIKK